MENIDNLVVYKGKYKTTYYYRIVVDGKRKKINLGHNLPNALQKIREIESTGSVVPKTLREIWNLYKRDQDDGLLRRALRTQQDYVTCWNMIEGLLGDVNLDSIRPSQIKQYIKRRTGKTRANREKALISILFNYAREYCDYDGSNPCRDLKGNKETGREKYVEKWEFEEIYVNADSTLKDVLDLLLYTGQRVGDVLDYKITDLKKNVDLTKVLMYNRIPASEASGKDKADMLKVKTNKTGKKIDIIIAGELERIINRILEKRKKSKVNSIYLIANEKGQKLSKHTLQGKFRKARELAGFKPFEIQMRDLRSKNACDSDAETANVRLAHTTQSMTDKYRDKVRSAMVMPLDKII